MAKLLNESHKDGIKSKLQDKMSTLKMPFIFLFIIIIPYQYSIPTAIYGTMGNKIK